MNMSVEDLIIAAKSGANIQIPVSPDQLVKSWENVAEITAKRILSSVIIQEKPMTEKEVSKLFKKSRQTLSKYRKEGKIRYHLLGREIIYYESELKEDMKNFE